MTKTQAQAAADRLERRMQAAADEWARETARGSYFCAWLEDAGYRVLGYACAAVAGGFGMLMLLEWLA